MRMGSLERLGVLSVVALLVVVGAILGRIPAPPAAVLAAGTPPDAPTGVAARAGDSSASVSWTPPLYTGGQPVLSYTVAASTGGGSCTATAPATSCTVSGLTDGGSFSFTVTATTANGTSAPSDQSAAVTPLAGTTGVNFIGTYGSVKWNSGTVGADGFTPSVDPLSKIYNDSAGTVADGVENAATVNASKCVDSWDWYQILCDPAGATNESSRVYKAHPDAGITFDTDNIATIRGYVVIDLGAVRNFTTLRIFQMFSDGKVTDAQLSVSSKTSDGFPTIGDGSWSTVAPRTGIGAGHGARSAGYVTCPTILDFGARSGRYVLLEFWNAGQFGNPSWVEVGAAKLFFENTVAPAASGCSPQPPTGVTAAAGNHSAQVAWTAASSADPLTGNAIQYSSNGGSSWSTATTSPTPIGGAVTSALVTGLTNGVPYVFRVSASNSSGTSPWSAPGGPVTPVAVPDPPTNVVATPGDGHAGVAWTASVTSGSSVTGYTVTSSPDGKTCVTGTSPTTCDGTELRNTVSYTFSVVAHSGAGDSLPGLSGAVIPFTTPDAPTNLMATAQDGSASIAFTAGGNGGSALINYEYSLGGSSWVPFSPATTASPAAVPGLTDGTAYSIRLRAVNVAGAGAASDPVSVTPHSLPTVVSSNPASLTQGNTAHNLTIAGTGFVTGAAATVSGTGVTVNSTAFVSATELTVNVTIASGATVGARNVTVTNPDTGTATGTGIFTVDPVGPPVSQTIDFPAPAGVRLDQPAPTLAATASSGLPVNYSTTTTAVCGVTNGVVSLAHVGTCAIDADQAGNAGYDPADRVSRSFTVSRGNQSIDFAAPSDAGLVDSPLTVTAGASSTLAVSFSSATPLVCTVTGDSVSLLATGTCSISADQPGNTDWNTAATATRTFAVTASSQGSGMTTDSDSPAPGASLHVTAWGFSPGASVAVYLHSEVVLLGTFTADGRGWIDVSVTLPAGTSAGAHEVEATGAGPHEQPVSVQHGISVPAAAATPAPVSTPPVTSAELQSGSGGSRGPVGPELSLIALTGLLAGALAAVYCSCGRGRVVVRATSKRP